MALSPWWRCVWVHPCGGSLWALHFRWCSVVRPTPVGPLGWNFMLVALWVSGGPFPTWAPWVSYKSINPFMRALPLEPNPNTITLDIRFQYVNMGGGHKYSVYGSKPQFLHLRNSDCLTCWLIVRTKKKIEEILSISACGTLNISRYVLLFILPSCLSFLSVCIKYIFKHLNVL